MVPPRVPQFNWIDLGLPSGTLWLDRMVGAPSPTESGLFYQWGDTIGHSLAEGYEFSLNNYTEKGLDLISSHLDVAHDAASAYYGPEARMPSYDQLNELIGNCVISSHENGVFLFTSNINGHSIKIRGNGYVEVLEHKMADTVNAWSRAIHVSDTETAYILRAQNNSIEKTYGVRYYGRNVMAVHS